jgi:hypothetical protein
MDAKFTILTNSTKGVIEYKNGAKIIFDQDKVFYSSTIPNENLSDLTLYMGIFFPFLIN